MGSEVQTAQERIKLVTFVIGSKSVGKAVGEGILSDTLITPGASLIFTSVSKGAATAGAVNIGTETEATKYNAGLSVSAALNPTAPTAAKVVGKGEKIIARVSTAIVGATDENPTIITLAFATL